jgi:hypothetical protein
MSIEDYSPDELVYHFTTSDTAINYILENGTLRIGKMQNTNDPTEFSRRLASFKNTTTKTTVDQPVTFFLKSSVETHQSFSDLFRNTQILCTTCDNHPASDYFRGYQRLRMWAQYGGRHEGVCLVFEKQAIDAAIRKQLARFNIAAKPIEYSKLTPDELDLCYTADIDTLKDEPYDINQHLMTYETQIFFTKLPDWRDEAEFRWVVRGIKDEEYFVEFKTALKYIVLGIRFDADKSNTIEKLAKAYGASVLHSQWNQQLQAIELKLPE